MTKNSENAENKIKLEEINTEISCLEADENRKILFENFQFFSDNPEKINMSNMWKLLKKLCPKNINAMPTAKKNHQGKIVSGPKEIKTLLAKEYKDRLRARPIRPDMIAMRKRKNRIFKLKMSLAERRESLDWNMKDLDRALSKLKNNKCRDYEGYINEIFKKGVIGIDLKKSLLVLFNKLKKQKMIPKFMNFANITTVPKKGSRLELRNERGIFRVSVVRSILMHLI